MTSTPLLRTQLRQPAACVRLGRLSRQPLPPSPRRTYTTSSDHGHTHSTKPVPTAVVEVYTGDIRGSFLSHSICAQFLNTTEKRRRLQKQRPFYFENAFCQVSGRNKQPSRSYSTSEPTKPPVPGEKRTDAVAPETTRIDNARATPTQAKDAARRDPVPVPVPGTVAPLPIWQRLGPLTRGAEAYARAQRRRPWITQVATMLVIYLCADISAQQISGKDEHEYARTARSLTIGGVAAIPGHMWFVFLSQHFNYPSKVLSIAVKVAINQAFFTPVFNTYFFGSQALLSGDSLQQAWDRVCATVPVSVVNSCKIWPVVTAVSFAYLPLEYRALFAGVVAVGWQTYLSFLNRQAEAAEALALATMEGSQKEGGREHSRMLSMPLPAKNAAESGASERVRVAAQSALPPM
ncbi:hypothetical protein PG993_002256 [Apiospora rasikravindrae]|uniref:Uncharacterized protein n=1 Tax=Apiospora rasikravindrae TaxID=990691 RepID=A0ABR1TYD4_9PEZI